MADANIPLNSQASFPDFNLSGVLPPFTGSTPTIEANMSPYRTTMTHIAEKLCTSENRKLIMRGLLDYRKKLNEIGLKDGFQWLSGSFLENIESLESRPPRDIDIVTFVHRPSNYADDSIWASFVTENKNLFDFPSAKREFKCDAYFVDLNVIPQSVVAQTRYWFGLFSHRRGGLWKGMLEVPLGLTEDDSTARLKVS